jgi:hypothetical protein
MYCGTLYLRGRVGRSSVPRTRPRPLMSHTTPTGPHQPHAGVVLYLTAQERIAVWNSIAYKFAQLERTGAKAARSDELTALRIIREHEDYLRLLEDLGDEAADPRHTFHVTMPARALGRTLAKLAADDRAVADVCLALLERLP